MVPSLFELAQEGDGDAFAKLVAPHRSELHRYCYRMLGSLTDADDICQETMLAAWRAIGDFCGRSSLRTWLYRIATNRCLNAVRDQKRRPPPVPVPPFRPPRPSAAFEATWLQPYPDAWLDQPADPQANLEAAETVRLAFVAALQRLAPRQAAAVVLCDVLGFSLQEVAEMLDATQVAAKGLLQRARAGLARDPRLSSSASQAPGPSAEDDEVARRFAEAYRADDVDAVVALLTDDAWLAMPPALHEYHGIDAIAAFFRASVTGCAGQRLGLVPTRANGQHGFVCFLRDPEGSRSQPSGVVVLDIAGGRVAGAVAAGTPQRSQGYGPHHRSHRAARAIVTLEGGSDDRDGLGGPDSRTITRREETEGWDLDAPSVPWDDADEEFDEPGVEESPKPESSQVSESGATPKVTKIRRRRSRRSHGSTHTSGQGGEDLRPSCTAQHPVARRSVPFSRHRHGHRRRT